MNLLNSFFRLTTTDGNGKIFTMEKQEVINYIADKLSGYGAKILDFNGDKFIGVKNPYSLNDMAFAFYDEVFTMEFTYQTARFSYDDYEAAAIHAEKFLNGKLVAVEIFYGGKPVMGGSREKPTTDISTKENFALWYAGGNSESAEKVLKFLNNGGVSAKVYSWSGADDKVLEF